MSKCLVTGGAGFIGSNLVDELIKRGDEVVIIDNLSTGKKENINSQAEFYEVDIRDLEKISLEGVLIYLAISSANFSAFGIVSSIIIPYRDNVPV